MKAKELNQLFEKANSYIESDNFKNAPQEIKQELIENLNYIHTWAKQKQNIGELREAEAEVLRDFGAGGALDESRKDIPLWQRPGIGAINVAESVGRAASDIAGMAPKAAGFVAKTAGTIGKDLAVRYGSPTTTEAMQENIEYGDRLSQVGRDIQGAVSESVFTGSDIDAVGIGGRASDFATQLATNLMAFSAAGKIGSALFGKYGSLAAQGGYMATRSVPEISDYIEEKTGEFKPGRALAVGGSQAIITTMAFGYLMNSGMTLEQAKNAVVAAHKAGKLGEIMFVGKSALAQGLKSGAAMGTASALSDAFKQIGIPEEDGYRFLDTAIAGAQGAGSGFIFGATSAALKSAGLVGKAKEFLEQMKAEANQRGLALDKESIRVISNALRNVKESEGLAGIIGALKKAEASAKQDYVKMNIKMFAQDVASRAGEFEKFAMQTVKPTQGQGQRGPSQFSRELSGQTMRQITPRYIPPNRDIPPQPTIELPATIETQDRILNEMISVPERREEIAGLTERLKTGLSKKQQEVREGRPKVDSLVERMTKGYSDAELIQYNRAASILQHALDPQFDVDSQSVREAIQEFETFPAKIKDAVKQELKSEISKSKSARRAARKAGSKRPKVKQPEKLASEILSKVKDKPMVLSGTGDAKTIGKKVTPWQGLLGPLEDKPIAEMTKTERGLIVGEAEKLQLRKEKLEDKTSPGAKREAVKIDQKLNILVPKMEEIAGGTVGLSEKAAPKKWYRRGEADEYTEFTFALKPGSAPRMSGGRGSGFATGQYSFGTPEAAGKRDEPFIEVEPAKNPLIVERRKDHPQQLQRAAITLMRLAEGRESGYAGSTLRDAAADLFTLAPGKFKSLDNVKSAAEKAIKTWKKNKQVHPMNILLGELGFDGIEFSGEAQWAAESGDYGNVKFPPVDKDGAVVGMEAKSGIAMRPKAAKPEDIQAPRGSDISSFDAAKEPTYKRIAKRIGEAKEAGVKPYILTKRKLDGGKFVYEAYSPRGELIADSLSISGKGSVSDKLFNRKDKYEDVAGFYIELDKTEPFSAALLRSRALEFDKQTQADIASADKKESSTPTKTKEPATKKPSQPKAKTISPRKLLHAGPPGVSKLSTEFSDTGVLWLTDSPEYAETLKLDKFEDTPAKIYEVNIKGGNFLDLREKDQQWERLRTDQEYVDSLKKNYDGVIIKDTVEGVTGDSYVIFNADQASIATAGDQAKTLTQDVSKTEKALDEFLNNGNISAKTVKELSRRVDSEEKINTYQESVKGISDHISQMIDSQTKLTTKSVTEIGNKAFGGTQASGQWTIKDFYDAVELSVNSKIMIDPELKSAYKTGNIAQFIDLVETKIYPVIPTQTKRTQEMDEFQQFSTPPALSAAVAWTANIKPGDVVLEPSAGIGGIAIFGKMDGAEVIVNELSKRRKNILELLPFDKVFSENAEQINNILPDSIKPNIVLMNPPFSSTAGRITGQRKTANATKHIEQALKRLEPNGRLVAIVGDGMGMDSPTFRSWWDQIKKDYSVVANLSLSGKQYRKYGTAFDNRLLVIDKKGPSEAKTIVGRFEHIKDALSVLEGIRNGHDITRVTRPTGGSKQESGLPQGGKSAAQIGQKDGRNAVSSPVLATGKPAKPGQLTAADRQDRLQPAVKRDGDMEPQKGDVAIRNESATERGSKKGAKGEESIRAGLAGDERTVSQDREQSAGSELEVKAGGAQQKKQELTDSIYDQYVPSVTVKGSRPHPGKLVESSAMAAVKPAKTNYTPNLPKSSIESGVISSAQLEAVIRAGHNHNQVLPDGKRKGFFIGDGTGVGKGAEISAILWDNYRQGRRKGLWVTKNSGLFSSARRDIEFIGWDPDVLFSLKDYSPIQKKEGILLVSYDTIKGKSKDGETRLKQILDWLGKDFDGPIVFDEAHGMGNTLDVKMGRGVKKASQRALAALDLRNATPNARITYSSATGATDPINLAYLERLGLWGPGTAFPTVHTFYNEITAGGIAAMEIVAADMKAMGVYVSRNLSYDGVEYDRLTHNLTPSQEKIYDTYAKAWQVVFRNIENAIEITSSDKSARSRAIGAFWGANQRFFSQVLTSLQTPSLIKSIKKDLESNKSAIIQITSTGEAQTNRAISGLEEGQSYEDLDLTPTEIISQYVENSFPVYQMEEYQDESGNTRHRYVIDSEGKKVENRDAVAARERLLNEIGSITKIDNPIDMILDAFGTDEVAEITGRSKRLVWKNGQRVLEKRSKSHVEADKDSFMGAKKRILVFSKAGGTGESFHADLTKLNQQKRHHYLLEPGWKSDDAVQGLGRSHRTNEASQPKYFLNTTNVPAQARFISTIARRLDQLGALGKGQRQTGSQGLFQSKDNLETTYARQAIVGFVRDLNFNGQLGGLTFEDFLLKTGLNLKDDLGMISMTKINEISVPQFLNRSLGLELANQKIVFEEIFNRLEAIVGRAAANGTLDVGMETLRAKSIKELRSEVARTDEESGAETIYHELMVENDAVYPKMPTGVHFEGEKLVDHTYYIDKSGNVGAVVSDVRTRGDGSSVQVEYRQFAKPKNPYAQVTVRALEKNYTKISKDKAAELWQKEVDALPKITRDKVHIISGTLLPVWDRLPKGSKKIMRTQTDDGKTILGRLINEREINETLEKLGLSGARVEASSAINNLIAGDSSLTLANDWKIKRSLVAGEQRIEVVDFDGFDAIEELKVFGAFMERIAYRVRVFIPVDRAAEVIKKIIKNKPIVKETFTRARGPMYSIEYLAAKWTAKGLKKSAEVIRAGARLFRSGLSKFADWAKRMINRFGKSVGKHLRAIFNDLKTAFKSRRGAIKTSGLKSMAVVNARNQQIERATSDVIGDPGAVYFSDSFFGNTNQLEYGEYLQEKYNNRNLDLILGRLATDQELRQYYEIDYGEETDPAFRGYTDDEVIYRNNQILTDAEGIRAERARLRARFREDQQTGMAELEEKARARESKKLEDFFGDFMGSRKGAINLSAIRTGIQLIKSGASKFATWAKAMLSRFPKIAGNMMRKLFARVNQYVKLGRGGAVSFRKVSPSSYPSRLTRAITHTNVGKLTKHPDYNAAKTVGDAAAAIRLSKDLIKPSIIAHLRKEIDRKKPVVFVPVINLESPQKNMIAFAYSSLLATEFNGQVWTNLFQGDRTAMTTAGAKERARSNFDFIGDNPPKDAQIIVVDDTFTSGNTTTSMIDKLSESGIIPTAVTSLAQERYQNWLKPSDQKIQAMLKKANMTEREFENEFGYQPGQLTGSEIQAYILNGAKGKEGIKARFPEAATSQESGIVDSSGMYEIGQRGNERIAADSAMVSEPAARPIDTTTDPNALYSIEYLVAKHGAKAVEKGWNLFKKGIRKFSDWAREMAKSFGKTIHKALRPMFADMQRVWADRRGAVGNIKKRIRTITKQTRLADEIKSIRPSEALKERFRASQRETKVAASRARKELIPQLKEAERLFFRAEDSLSKAEYLNKGKKIASDLIKTILPVEKRAFLLQQVDNAKTMDRLSKVSDKAVESADKFYRQKELDRFKKLVSRTSQVHEVVGSVRQELLDGLQLDNGRTALKTVRLFLRDFEDSYPDMGVPWWVVRELDDAIALKRPAVLSVSEMEVINDGLQFLVDAQKIIKSAIVGGRYRDVKEIAKSVENHLAGKKFDPGFVAKTLRPKSDLEETSKFGFLGLVSPASYMNEDGLTFAEMFGPDGKEVLYDQTVKGDTVQNLMMQRGEQELQNIVTRAQFEPDGAKFNEWRKEIVLRLKDRQGKAISLTRGERLYLAGLAQFQRARKFLPASGVVLSRYRDMDVIDVTEELLDKITASLTPQERVILDGIVFHVNENILPALNDVHQNIKAYPLVPEWEMGKKYLPVSKDRAYKGKQVRDDIMDDQAERLVTPSGFSFVKQAVDNTHPFRITDIIDVFKEHVIKTAVYVGHAEDVRNIEMLRNMPGMEPTIIRSLGKERWNRLKLLVEGLSQAGNKPPAELSKWYMKALRTIMPALLTPRSMMIQYTSLAYTTSHIPFEHILDATFTFRNHRPIAVKELMEKDPDMWRRLSRYAGNILYSGNMNIDKTSTFVKPFAHFDGVTMVIIHEAARAYAKEIGKSEEWASDLANRTIRETQNTGTVPNATLTQLSAAGGKDIVAYLGGAYSAQWQKTNNHLKRLYRSKMSKTKKATHIGFVLVSTALTTATVDYLIAKARGKESSFAESIFRVANDTIFVNPAMRLTRTTPKDIIENWEAGMMVIDQIQDIEKRFKHLLSVVTGGKGGAVALSSFIRLTATLGVFKGFPRTFVTWPLDALENLAVSEKKPSSKSERKKFKPVW